MLVRIAGIVHQKVQGRHAPSRGVRVGVELPRSSGLCAFDELLLELLVYEFDVSDIRVSPRLSEVAASWLFDMVMRFEVGALALLVVDGQVVLEQVQIYVVSRLLHGFEVQAFIRAVVWLVDTEPQMIWSLCVKACLTRCCIEVNIFLRLQDANELGLNSFERA